MKKYIIALFLLLFTTSVFAQKIQFIDTAGGKPILREVSYKWPLPVKLAGAIPFLNTNNVWTGINYFNRAVFDTVTTNFQDSVTSTYWYRPNGTLFGFIDASRDSAYFDKMYIGSLGTYTIVNGSSVTTNSLISDTIISHSPLLLRSDSVSFGKTNDTAKVWYNQITRNNSVRGAIYPKIDYGSSLGTYNTRWDTVNARVGKFQSIDNIAKDRLFSSYIVRDSSNNKIVEIGAMDNYGMVGGIRITNLSNNNVLTIGSGLGGFDNSAITASRSLNISGGTFGVKWYSGMSTAYPLNDTAYNLGISGTNRWRNTYTRTLNADSIKVATQILAPNGSSTSPSFSFSNKTTKGIYLIDTSTIGISGNLTVTSKVTVDTVSTKRVNFLNALDYVIGTNNIDRFMVDMNGNFSPLANKVYSIGLANNRPSNVITSSLNTSIDSVGGVTDSLYIGRQTLLVSTGAVNDTIFLSDYNVIAGQEYDIKKVDSGAGSVVVKSKSGFLIDGQATDTFSTQYVSRRYKYKLNAWYIF